MTEIKIYKNKNGYLEVEELVGLVHIGDTDDYIRRFRVSENKCVPIALRNENIGCFHCEQCYRDAIEQIKEYKDSYKVKGKKYMKEDLEGQINLFKEEVQ